MAGMRIRAIKRLSRDLKEWRADRSTQGIAVAPLEDLLTLHVNFRLDHGVYKGAVLHCIMRIPDSYPTTGPAMDIAPGLYFPHEHVFGTSVCNDLLTNFGTWFKYQDSVQGGTPLATGWNESYTLCTMLHTMQAFLADPEMPVTDSQIRRVLKSCRAYTCTECDHTGQDPYPPLPVHAPCHIFEDRTQCTCILRDAREDGNVSEIVPGPDDSTSHTHSVRKALRQEVCCYVCKQTLDHPGIVIGFGVLVEKKKGQLYVTSPLEFLSYEAFRDGCRRSSRNHVTFTHFLPLYLDREHWARARPIAEHCISQISASFSALFLADTPSSNLQSTGSDALSFQPSQVLDIVPKLLNKMVLDIVKGDLAACDRAIEGYYYFLGLMDAFLVSYPVLIDTIDLVVGDFVSHPQRRSKTYVPDLGEFLVIVTLSRVEWATVRHAYLPEHLTRTILWILRASKDGGGSQLFRKSDKKLVDKGFHLSQTGFHLMLFNLEIARRFSHRKPTAGVLTFDDRLGCPEPSDVAAVKAEIHRILDISSYTEFYRCAGEPVPSTSLRGTYTFLANRLKEARNRSDALKYTFPEGSARKPDRHRSSNGQAQHSPGGKLKGRAAPSSPKPPNVLRGFEKPHHRKAGGAAHRQPRRHRQADSTPSPSIPVKPLNSPNIFSLLADETESVLVPNPDPLIDPHRQATSTSSSWTWSRAIAELQAREARHDADLRSTSRYPGQLQVMVEMGLDTERSRRVLDDVAGNLQLAISSIFDPS